MSSSYLAMINRVFPDIMTYSTWLILLVTSGISTTNGEETIISEKRNVKAIMEKCQNGANQLQQFLTVSSKL